MIATGGFLRSRPRRMPNSPRTRHSSRPQPKRLKPTSPPRGRPPQQDDSQANQSQTVDEQSGDATVSTVNALQPVP